MLNAFVINLDDHIEKRVKISSLMTDTRVRVSFVKAVDGRIFNSEIMSLLDSSQALEVIGRDMGSREVACALSHISCYKALLKSKDEWCLILEDDILFRQSESASKLVNVIDSIISVIPQSECGKVVLLGHHLTYDRNRDGVPSKRGHRALIKHSSACNNSQLLSYFAERPSGGYAYLINRRAAQVRIKDFKSVNYPIDYWVPSRNFSIYGVFPPIFDFDKDSKSDISLDRGEEPSRGRALIIRSIKVATLRILSKIKQKVCVYD